MGDGLVFIHFEEPAGERPLADVCRCAGIFFLATFDEEHFEFFAVVSEDHAVGRDGRVGVFVCVLTFRCHSRGLFLQM